MSKLDDSKTYTKLVDFQESVKYWRKGIAMHHSGLIIFKKLLKSYIVKFNKDIIRY